MSLHCTASRNVMIAQSCSATRCFCGFAAPSSNPPCLAQLILVPFPTLLGRLHLSCSRIFRYVRLSLRLQYLGSVSITVRVFPTCLGRWPAVAYSIVLCVLLSLLRLYLVLMTWSVKTCQTLPGRFLPWLCNMFRFCIRFPRRRFRDYHRQIRRTWQTRHGHVRLSTTTTSHYCRRYQRSLFVRYILTPSFRRTFPTLHGHWPHCV